MILLFINSKWAREVDSRAAISEFLSKKKDTGHQDKSFSRGCSRIESVFFKSKFI